MQNHSDIACARLNQLQTDLDTRGFSVKFRTDMDAWVDFMSEPAAYPGYINHAFDPEVCQLQCAFWLELLGPDSEGIGCIAGKVIDCDDVLEEMASYRLWFGPDPELDGKRMAINRSALSETLGGRIAHYGGLWIHPDYRHRRLTRTLHPIARAFTVQIWRPEWFIGLVTQKIADGGLPRNLYGYAKAVQITTDDEYAVTGKVESLTMPFEGLSAWRADADTALDRPQQSAFAH